MGILRLGRKKKVVEEVAPEPQVIEQPTGPALVLLVPEAAGVTSFRMMRFFDVADAAEYVSTLPRVTISGIHAFWGLLEMPEESPAGDEALVVIRSESSVDLVYVVSFIDIESALSFARFEVKRGLAPGSLIIWWAVRVTITETEDAIHFTPAEPPKIVPGALASATTRPTLSPSLEKARLRQEQEKSRLQAELEEIRHRQAQTEELHRRQAQVDDRRKQLALAEKQRRQTKAEEQRRLRAEAEEIAKLRAEAEELRKRQAEAEEHERREAHARRLQAEQDKKARLQVEAEEGKRLQAELELIERQQAKAEERERREAVERELRAEAEGKRRQAEADEMMRLQAEAEEQARQLAEELRLLAKEETGRRHAEAEAKPRLQAEAEQTRLLQAELGEIKRRQSEAEDRWRQEAEERRLRAEAEEEKRRDVEDEKRRLEAEETKRMQAELAEIRRQRAEAAEASLRTEEDEKRRQAEAERAGRLQVGLEEIKRQQLAAEERWRQETEERRLQGEAEERKRREVEDDERRLEAEETRIIQAKLEEIRNRLAEAQISNTNAEKSPFDADAELAGQPAEAEGARTQPIQPLTDVSGEGASTHRPVDEPPALYDSLAQSRPPVWAEGSDTATNEAPGTVIEGAAPAPDDAAAKEDGVSEATQGRYEVSLEPEPVEITLGENADSLLEIAPEEEVSQEARVVAHGDDFPFADEQPMVAEPPSFLRDDGAVTPQSPFELGAGEDDRASSDDVSAGDDYEPSEREAAPEPELPTLDEPLADDEWRAPEIPIEETVAVSANGASNNGLYDSASDDSEPPETIPGEDNLSPEMAAFLRSRRRDKKDNPFRGFESPPGRF